MTNWKTYRLGNICTLNYGKALTATNRVAGDIPVYSSAGITGSHNVALVQSKGIIVGRKGTVGTVYYSDKPFYCIDTAYYILPDDEKYNFKWLYYRLKSLHLDKLNEDSAVPGLNRETAYAQEISLPPLKEQRRIVGILDAIDDKIENNRRINDNLEQQAQALYKQWFVDFEFPNEDGNPYKSSGRKMVDSELGQIPKGWSVGTIYKYVNVVYGAPYKSALFNERKDGNPLIRIRDLKTFSPQYYTQEILPNTEFINAGDVIAGMDAEFVPCLWMGEKGVLNQRCCKFASKQDSISNYYVMFLVKPELEFVQSYKTGTTVSHLGKADIDKFVVIQPPLIVIEEFSKIADALLYNKVKLAKENITLAILRDTLLPKLMNGEIKIDE